jgi:hypothetical protein
MLSGRERRDQIMHIPVPCILLALLVLLPSWVSAEDTRIGCSQDSDCAWISDGSCRGCWNTSVSVADVGRGKCVQRMFCLCEDSICKYPSKSWIAKNQDSAMQRCSALEWNEDCLEGLAVTTNNMELCDKFQSKDAAKRCRAKTRFEQSRKAR